MGSRYCSVHRNDFGSHWQTDHDTVMDFRRMLLRDPEIQWAYLIYSTTGRIVESYTRPRPRGQRR